MLTSSCQWGREMGESICYLKCRARQGEPLISIKIDKEQMEERALGSKKFECRWKLPRVAS